jgi:hypothetical protein
VIETGLIRSAAPLLPTALARLHHHLQEEQAALTASDIGQRSFLLGDFHVCLAECLGNQLLADILRDLTARTTLIAMLYQSRHDAHQSCEEHVYIVAALERGDHAEAERLTSLHIEQVQAALSVKADTDPLAELRAALTPLAASSPALRRSRRTRREDLAPTLADEPLPTGQDAGGAAAFSSPSDSDSETATYLGAVL